MNSRSKYIEFTHTLQKEDKKDEKARWYLFLRASSVHFLVSAEVFSTSHQIFTAHVINTLR